MTIALVILVLVALVVVALLLKKRATTPAEPAKPEVRAPSPKAARDGAALAARPAARKEAAAPTPIPASPTAPSAADRPRPLPPENATERDAEAARAEAPTTPAEPARDAAAVAPSSAAPAHATRPLLPHTDVGTLRRGLARSRDAGGFFGRLRAVFGGRRELDADVAAELEEALLASDVGVRTTATILERVRASLGARELGDSAAAWEALRAEARRILEAHGGASSLRLDHHPTVVLLVGVNGAGKTTTIGKLATRLQGEGKRAVLAAGDTFRAAAVQQLQVWGERAGCEVVSGKAGSDPSSVIFEAVRRAQETGADLVLADTAGRLHTKTNLMAEMEKVVRTVGKALEGAPHEVLLVLDATNGQNALAQATQFRDALPVTGLVLTKLDGTAKGGVILGICDELKLPVRFVGLGEKATDLHEFVAHEFVEALLGSEARDAAA